MNVLVAAFSFLAVSKALEEPIMRQHFISESADIVVVAEHNIYIPLGHDHNFTCHAAKKVKHITVRPHRWRLVYSDEESRHTVVYDLHNMTRNSTHFQITGDSTLYGIQIQPYHHGLNIECVVGIAGKPTVFVSRNHIHVQDCSGADESINKANPCKYGRCMRTKDSNNLGYINCSCLPEFTGAFCTEMLPEAIRSEFHFYSPIFFLAVVIILLSCFSPALNQCKKIRVMRLEQHVPEFDRSINLGKLYQGEELKDLKEESSMKRNDEISSATSKKTANNNTTSSAVGEGSSTR